MKTAGPFVLSTRAPVPPRTGGGAGRVNVPRPAPKFARSSVTGPRRLAISGQIDRAMADHVESAVGTSAHRPLIVSVTSPGGSMSAAMRCYTALRRHPGQVTAQVIGEASSGAAIAMLGAAARTLMYGSTIMLHEGRFGPDDVVTAADEAFLARENVRLAAIVGLRTGAGFSRARDWLQQEATFTNYQAEAVGLVHRVTRS